MITLFPTSHIRPYSHAEASGRAPLGKAVTDAQKAWSIMAPPSHERPESLPDPKFLTIAEVASVMRVSKMTVYRLVHNGDLPAVRVGRSFRVTEEDVNDYLRKSFFNAG